MVVAFSKNHTKAYLWGVAVACLLGATLFPFALFQSGNGRHLTSSEMSVLYGGWQYQFYVQCCDESTQCYQINPANACQDRNDETTCNLDLTVQYPGNKKVCTQQYVILGTHYCTQDISQHTCATDFYCEWDSDTGKCTLGIGYYNGPAPTSCDAPPECS